MHLQEYAADLCCLTGHMEFTGKAKGIVWQAARTPSASFIYKRAGKMQLTFAALQTTWMPQLKATSSWDPFSAIHLQERQQAAADLCCLAGHMGATAKGNRHSPAGTLNPLNAFHLHECQQTAADLCCLAGHPDATATGNRCNVGASWNPFSCGPRNCLGQGLAIAELRTVLAVLLANFRYKSVKIW